MWERSGQRSDKSNAAADARKEPGKRPPDAEKTDEGGQRQAGD